jgi:hypothetical protein
MNKSDSIKELASALAKAQAGFGHIARDKTVKVITKSGGSYTFSYAPLETIMAAIKQPLVDNGLALIQGVRDERVVTTLMHQSGEFYESAGTPIKAVEQGPQAYGSALTYSRRYDLSLTLGLCPDDDDDGNGAEGNSVQSKKKEEKAPDAEGAAALLTCASIQDLQAAWEKLNPAQRASLGPTKDAVKARLLAAA